MYTADTSRKWSQPSLAIGGRLAALRSENFGDDGVPEIANQVGGTPPDLAKL